MKFFLRDPCEKCLVRAKCDPLFRRCELTEKYEKDKLKIAGKTIACFQILMLTICFGITIYNLFAPLFGWKIIILF